MQNISRKKILLIILIAGGLLLALFAFNAPGAINLSCNESGVTVTIDATAVGSCGQHIISKGNHTIKVNKNGYHEYTHDVAITPFSQVNLTVNVAPRIIKEEIAKANNGIITINSTHTAAYCDRFKNSICLNIDYGNQLDFTETRDTFLGLYSADNNLPLIFSWNSQTSTITVYQSSKLVIYLTGSDEIDKPVLVIETKDSSVSKDDVAAAITDTLKGYTYEHYAMYLREDLKQYNVMPSNAQLYWNNETGE